MAYFNLTVTDGLVTIQQAESPPALVTTITLDPADISAIERGFSGSQYYALVHLKTRIRYTLTPNTADSLEPLLVAWHAAKRCQDTGVNP